MEGRQGTGTVFWLLGEERRGWENFTVAELGGAWRGGVADRTMEWSARALQSFGGEGFPSHGWGRWQGLVSNALRRRGVVSRAFGGAVSSARGWGQGFLVRVGEGGQRGWFPTPFGGGFQCLWGRFPAPRGATGGTTLQCLTTMGTVAWIRGGKEKKKSDDSSRLSVRSFFDPINQTRTKSWSAKG